LNRFSKSCVSAYDALQLPPRTILQQCRQSPTTPLSAGPPVAPNCLNGPIKRNIDGQTSTARERKWFYTLSGSDLLCRLPRDLFFQVSAATPVAGPGNIRLHLPAGLDSGSFEHIERWFDTCCGAGGYTRMRYFDDMYQDLALCRAARLLDLQLHVQHIHNFYWAYFKKKRIPDYEDLEVVVSLHLPGHEDPFMSVVATHLGHLKYHSEIPDPHEFEEWLMLHPVLESKVMEVVQGLEKAGREKRGPAYTGWEMRGSTATDGHCEHEKICEKGMKHE
jgi:hypothetical protein